jgi:hypothetical protein
VPDSEPGKRVPEARLRTRSCSWGFVVHPPEVGARCVNYARRDLCGGCPVMGIPTAIAPGWGVSIIG